MGIQKIGYFVTWDERRIGKRCRVCAFAFVAAAMLTEGGCTQYNIMLPVRASNFANTQNRSFRIITARMGSG